MVYVKYVFGLLIILLGIFYLIQAWTLLFPEEQKLETAAVTEAALADALNRSRESGKPVLVDVYADWCKNCVAMKHSTFKDPKVQEALKNYEFLVFDATDVDNPEVQKVLKRFDIKGLPAFLVLKPEK